MDMFLQDNLSDLTRNMGFADEDIIWLYSYFTDLKLLQRPILSKGFGKGNSYDITRREINGKVVKLFWPGRYSSMQPTCVKRVKILFTVWKKYRVVCLIRKDFLLLH